MKIEKTIQGKGTCAQHFIDFLELARKKKLVSFFERRKGISTADVFVDNKDQFFYTDFTFQKGLHTRLSEVGRFFFHVSQDFFVYAKDELKNGDDWKIWVFSSKEFHKEDIEEIFPESFQVYYREGTFDYNRKDFSVTLESVPFFSRSFDRPSGTVDAKIKLSKTMYTAEIIYESSMTKKPFSFDEVLNFDFMKKFLEETTLELISSNIQKSNCTFVFRVPAHYVENSSKEVLWKISKLGYVKKETRIPGGPFYRFDASTEEGWNSAVERMIKEIKKFYNDSFPLTKEEAYRRRGHFTGKKFGI